MLRGRSRRQFMGVAGWSGAIVGSGLLVSSAGKLIRPAMGAEKGEQDEPKVSPPEDLMREHGVLDRVLLIYEAGARKLSANADFDPMVLSESAGIVRDFIHDYHEKSEEDHVFPRFKQAGKLVDLIDTLLQQHRAGRRVTERILSLAPASRENTDKRRQITQAMQAFITMYRPHAAREDTVLFPQLKNVVSPSEYDAMAEDFEKQEHRQFGGDGFEMMVARTVELEKALGIFDLEQFTPA